MDELPTGTARHHRQCLAEAETKSLEVLGSPSSEPQGFVQTRRAVEIGCPTAQWNRAKQKGQKKMHSLYISLLLILEGDACYFGHVDATAT